MLCDSKVSLRNIPTVEYCRILSQQVVFTASTPYDENLFKKKRNQGKKGLLKKCLKSKCLRSKRYKSS